MCWKVSFDEVSLFLSKETLMYPGSDPGKPNVLLMVRNGVAAVNIDGNTIHSGLGINCKGHVFPLNDQQKASLHNKLRQKLGQLL